MKHRKRLTIGLSMLLLLSLLAGCSNASPTPAAVQTSPAATASGTGSDATQEPAPKEREHLDISVYFPMHASASLEDVPEGGYMLDKMYEEKFNITLDIQRIPNTNADEMYNVMIASGDIPDVVKQGSWSKLNKYQEAWWPLNDFIIGKYPNLEEIFFKDPFINALSTGSDGNIKIVSMISDQFIGDVLLVRGDLVEEWGLDIASYKTKEDITELLRMVKEKDPSLVPYMTRFKIDGLIDRLSEGWSGIRKELFVDSDGQVKYGGADERMKEVITWLHGLYKEGLIDQEFSNTDTAKWGEQVLNDGVFMTHDNASSRIKWAEVEWGKLGVTGKFYQAVPPIQPDENTTGYTTIHYPTMRDAAAVFIGASEAKVDRIMEIFNYNFSEEGNLLLSYGIEGKSFRYNEQGEIDDIPEYRKGFDEKTLPSDQWVRGDFAQIIRREPNTIYSPQNRPYQNVLDAAKMYEDGGLIRQNWVSAIRFDQEEQKRVTTLAADIKTYTDENLTQFIVGIRPLDQWDTFVAGYDALNLQEYLDLHNASLEKVMEKLN